MKVFHFVYTKVNREDSPWGKTDFHTVFYPLRLLKPEDLRDIEKRIYVPPLEYLHSKEAGFYKEINGEQYLILLQIRSLPGEKDAFGREGIFMCHGFIFPSEIWKSAVSPSSLFAIVNKYVFLDRKQMLDSSLVNRKTGDTIPLEVPEETLKEASFMTLPTLAGDNEWRMAIFLNRWIRQTEGAPRIVFRGEPGKVSDLLNKMFAYIPLPLRLKLSWDTQFDGGSLTFYPFQVVGYNRERPRGGEILEIDCETMAGLSHQEFSMPESPYERWLDHCRSQVRTVSDIEKAYNLSLLLQSGAPSKQQEMLSETACFASANKEVIQNVFLKRSQVRLGKELGTYVYSALEPQQMLNILAEDFPPEQLVELVERIILTRRLTPKTLTEALPDFVLKVDSKRMSLIQKVWKGQPITPADLHCLDRDDAHAFVQYIILAEWAEEEWLIDLLKQEPDILEGLRGSPETKRAVEEILTRLLERNAGCRGIENLIVKGVVSQRKEFLLLKENLDVMELLEHLLKDGIWTDEEMEKICRWAKKRKPDVNGRPYLKAFLYPKQGVADVVMKDTDVRTKLLMCLLRIHGFNESELGELGFDEEEIRAAQFECREKEQGRLNNLIKGLLSFFERTDKR